MSRYILPVLLILLSFAIYGFYIDPLYSAIEQDVVKDAEVKAALVEADTAQAQLDEIAKRYESFPSDADAKLSEIIPESVDQTRLLIDTTTFLNRNGFPSNSVTVSSGSEAAGNGAPYQVHTIAFSVSASYDTFREFLHILESSLALRDMSGVSFSAALATESAISTKPELAIHEYSIQIKSYSLH